MKILSKYLSGMAFIVLACFANLALAHNSLKASSPAADAQLMQAPAAIELTFSDVTYLEAMVLLKDDMEIDIGFEADDTRANSFAVALPELAPGSYTVNWMVVGDDTHEIKGSFSFVIKQEE